MRICASGQRIHLFCKTNKQMRHFKVEPSQFNVWPSFACLRICILGQRNHSLIGKQAIGVSRCRYCGINNSPPNFTSTCFYSDFHVKQVDVTLAGKIILKSSLNAPNNHQTYHHCRCLCCPCILHRCCRCLNLSPAQAPSSVALPLLCTVVSLLCLLILAIPLYLSTDNTSRIDYN